MAQKAPPPARPRTGPAPFFEGWFLRAVAGGGGGSGAAAAAAATTGTWSAAAQRTAPQDSLHATAAAALPPPPALTVSFGIALAAPAPGSGADPPAVCFVLIQRRGADSRGGSTGGGGGRAPSGQPPAAAAPLPPPEVHTLYFSRLDVRGGKDPPAPPLGPPGEPSFVAEGAGPAGRCRLEVSGPLVAAEAEMDGLKVGTVDTIGGVAGGGRAEGTYAGKRPCGSSGAKPNRLKPRAPHPLHPSPPKTGQHQLRRRQRRPAAAAVARPRQLAGVVGGGYL
jgi:hypothetical protein